MGLAMFREKVVANCSDGDAKLTMISAANAAALHSAGAFVASGGILTPKTGAHHHCVAVSNAMLITCAHISSDSPPSLQLHALPSMLSARAAHATACTPTGIFVCGGFKPKSHTEKLLQVTGSCEQLLMRSCDKKSTLASSAEEKWHSKGDGWHYRVHIEWQPAPSLATPRANHAMCMSKGGVIIASGGVTTDCNNRIMLMRLCEMLLPNDHKWREVPSLLTPRMMHGMAASKSAVYAVGGSTLPNHRGVSFPLSSVEMLPIHQETGTPVASWTRLPNMPFALLNPTVTPCDGGAIVVRGCTMKQHGIHGDRSVVMRYSAITTKWEVV